MCKMQSRNANQCAWGGRRQTMQILPPCGPHTLTEVQRELADIWDSRYVSFYG